MEHHDYEAVPPEVWKYLVAWYGFKADQTPIMRLISFDKRTNKFFVDLYLEGNRDLSTIHFPDDTDISRDETNQVVTTI